MWSQRRPAGNLLGPGGHPVVREINRVSLTLHKTYVPAKPANVMIKFHVCLAHTLTNMFKKQISARASIDKTPALVKSIINHTAVLYYSRNTALAKVK